MRRPSTRRLGITAFASVLGLGLTACDKSSSGAAAPGDPGEGTAAKGPAQGKHELIGNAAMLDELHPSASPNTAGLLKSAGHREGSYDASAPATVLVATTWGHGSGVIIDEAGWILTNNHVVESGETADFGIEVAVTVPKIADDGRATPGKTYKARAFKTDPRRDLALLKIMDAEPGTKFPVAPLAKQGPRPGTAVAAVGNAGVGFGWAIKHCSVNAVGTMESAAQVIFAQQHETLADQYKDQIAKAAKDAATKAGTLIQTDCTILPGDSGGPLIDESTHEVVGLNVAVKPWTERGQQLGSVAFHIHLDELLAFTGELGQQPAQPPTFVPDPWELGGAEGISADTDADGEIDSFKLLGMCGGGNMCGALFVDVDQDSFGDQQPESLSKVYEDRAFDAEFVIYHRGRMPRAVSTKGAPVPVTDEYFYFDRDGDGVLDGLLVHDTELDERRGYSRTGDHFEPDAELNDKGKIDASVFEQAAIRDRFEAYKVAFNTGGRAGTTARSSALEIVTGDSDGDGTVDTALVNTRVDERLLIDLDQNAKLDENLAKRLTSSDVDVEFMAVKGSPLRIYYDTDDDGGFDLLLEGTDAEHGMAQRAFVLSEGAEPKPAPIHVGRKLLRPQLGGPHAARLAKDLGELFETSLVASDEGLGSFPDMSASPRAEVQPYDDVNEYLLAVEDVGRIMVMVDLDRDTYKGKHKPAKGEKPDARSAVREGWFDAELVFVFDGTISWAYYDTDADGDWDVINVSHGGDPLHAHFRFGHEKGAKVISGAPVTDRHDLLDPAEFKNKTLRKRFEKVVDRVVDR